MLAEEVTRTGGRLTAGYGAAALAETSGDP
jgi:hypothetical protein